MTTARIPSTRTTADGVDLLIRKLGARDHVSRVEQAVLGSLMGAPSQHSAGSMLLHPGDRPTESTLLVDGYCARFAITSDGDRQITELHLPGDFVDLHSFVLKTMDHGIVALSECTTAGAPHSALRAVTETQPHLTRLLWLSTLIDAAIHRQWIVKMGRQDARSRLAHLVCETYVRLQCIGLASDGAFDFPLTQVQVADTLGLTVVHVNRTLQDLRASGLLEWGKGRVLIADFERLAGVADFDPTYLRLVYEPV